MKDHESNAGDPFGFENGADFANPVNRDSVSDSWGRVAAYDAYADGLHTYALGGLRNHEAAASAVYCTFVAADHHVAHLGDAEMLRPWLYAITRHYCRAGKLPRMRMAVFSKGSASGDGSKDVSLDASTDKERAMAGLERSLLAAELSSLDWPDTDGLSAAHREVLELSVRHGMESRAVGLILGKPAAESFELLSAAWHELERSLAATALLRTRRSHCPDLATLAEGWNGRLTAQRREPLVAHVDACSRCQYHLHKVVGAPQAPSILPHVPAPKELRERVLGDLLDTGPEREAEKAAIAARLSAFDALGFPAGEGVARTIPRPRPAEAAATAEKRPHRLGSLLAGRVPSAEAEATADALGAAGQRGGVASESNQSETASVWSAEGVGHDGSFVSDEAPVRRRGVAAAADRSLESVGNTHEMKLRGRVGRGGFADDALFASVGADAVAPAGDRETDSASAVRSRSSNAGARRRGQAVAGGDDFLAVGDGGAGAEVGAAGAVRSRSPKAGARRRGEVLVEGAVPAAGRREPSAGSAGEASVFADLRTDRPVSTTAAPRPRRNSVGAAIEGRRRGAAEAGPRRVSDSYEAAATVAAAMAAEDVAPRPRIAPAGSGRRVALAQPVRRKSAFRSALTSSAVLSGAGAAGVTAFVLFVPTSANGNKTTLFAPPDQGGSSSQVPDYPQPSSTSAGPALPVAGNLNGGGPGGAGPGGDTVTARLVAAVVPASSTSVKAPASGPTSPGTVTAPPFNGLPSATGGAPSQGPSSGSGQLNIRVTQRSNNPAEVNVTLWNSGTAPVSWTATADAHWLRLSAVSGILAPGAQTSMTITVDHSAEPAAPWQAHVRFDPSGQLVSVSGDGNPGTPSTTPSTKPSSTPSSTPSTPPSSTPSPPASSSSSPSSSPSNGTSSSSQGTPSTTATSPTSPTGAPTASPTVGTPTTSQPSTTPTGAPPTQLPTTPHR